MYWALQHRFNLHLHHPRGWTGRLVFTKAIDALFALARRVTAGLEDGALQRHVAVLVSAALVAGAWPWLMGAAWPGTGNRVLLPADAVSITLWLLLLVTGAALVLGHHQRLRAVVLAGVVGLITALAFVALSAPDLALTQLSVEVVSTVLLLMGLALLPPTTPRESSALRRWRDGVLACAGGAGMAALTWLMLTRGHDAISWYFLENSVARGGGSNVVNVILVDFRGYDTFGEITVLGIAGLGVMALLQGWRTSRPAADGEGRVFAAMTQAPLLLRQVAPLVLPLALVVSLYIFWRGHNLPGGGFIAGLITAVALVLQYVALGQARAEAVLHAAGGQRFVRWVAIGLGIAWMTGVGAFVFGRPFLTSAFGHPVVPVLGELPLATAALFDLGVYITVVGATLLTLSVLGGASKEGSAAALRPRGAAGSAGPGGR
jgi:multicomponent K+:H+ antiporter subunit A